MRYSSPSPFIALTVMATQLLGPAVLLAAEQRGIRIEANRQIIVSALSGDQLTAQGERITKALQFREVLAEGAILTTGAGTTAELLIGNRAVVTLGNETTVQVRIVSADQTTIQVTKGTVRVAAAASAVGPQGLVTVQTPTSQVQTRGGILRVTVDAPFSKAEHAPTGAQAYRASYAPGSQVAAVTPSGDIIHVEEGTAEIPGVGPTGGPFTMKAGQRVTVQAGRAGSLAEAVNPGAVTAGILATTGHTNTPKEGRDYLVALQVNQAAKLGQALTGAAETGSKALSQKSDNKNVINGATGGVTLVSNSNPSPNNPNPGNPGPGPGGVGNPFGPGGFFSGTGGSTVNNSGSAVLDDVSDVSNDPRVVLDKSIDIRVKGGAGLLLFTERPLPLPEEIEDKTIRSNFSVKKELLLIDGGNQSRAPHGGNAPRNTLIARATNGTNLKLEFRIEDGPSGDEAARAITKVILTGDPKEVLKTKNYNSDLNPPFTDEECNSFNCYGTGTLSDFSSEPNGVTHISEEDAFIDGVISARSATTGNRLVTLAGGAVLDKQTTVSLGKTVATDAYFSSKPGLSNLGATSFNGSLLTVLASKDGGFNPAFVKVQNRLLGVLGGSSIRQTTGTKTALLSVLDSRVIGPDQNDPATGANGRKPGEIAPLLEFDGSGQVTRNTTKATVTSAVVVRSTDVTFDGPLDGALLSASSPILAMITASMSTKGHFADLAGNIGRPALLASLVPGDALVRLDNSALTIQGNLLHLTNATAAVTGYLFSLNNGSSIQLTGGSLFSLNGNSSLTLNGNAFGVFGSGTNTLMIDNNLCGAGAACGALVNSAGQAITLQDGTALQVAGVTQNVVLPNGFSVFAQATPNAPTPQPQIGANDALFQIDTTSTLTINGTQVK